MDIFSILAIFILFGFVLMNYPQRNNFFTRYSIHGFLDLYTKILSAFFGLFLYVASCMLSESEPLECAVFSAVVAIGTGWLIDGQEFGKYKITIPGFLEEKIVYNEQFWIVGIMVVFLSLPFIGIFAIQSSFEWGIAWFYGTLAVIYVVHLISRAASKSINSAIDWLTCIFDTEG